MLTKYGYMTIGIVAIIVFVLFAASIFVNNNLLKYLLLAASLGLLSFTLYFFRDPDRTPPKEDNVVVSPADGKVIVIKKVRENQFINGEATQISIFMSPFNVHVNRIPISGQVEYLNYIEGEYLIASHDKADQRNERNIIGIKGKYGKVLFTQVAGMVARRIVSELNQGDSVEIGNRFGMIKFGSRVDVLVSAKHEINVKEGDNVTAGETILFNLNEEN